MNKNFLLACSLLLCSCFSKSAMMTQETFTSVQVGFPVQRVIDANGEPYTIRYKNGLEEYVYVERVTNGNQLIYENHFILHVRDGVVVGKSTTQERVPPFDIMYQDDPNHNQYP